MAKDRLEQVSFKSIKFQLFLSNNNHSENKHMYYKNNTPIYYNMEKKNIFKKSNKFSFVWRFDKWKRIQ